MTKVKKVVEVKDGFKVVELVKGKMLSCSVGKLKVHYVVDKFVGPRTFGGPLTIFDNPYDAIGFIKKLDNKHNMRVYRAKYIPTDVFPVGRFTTSGYETNKFPIPNGTVLARKIKITKRVF